MTDAVSIVTANFGPLRFVLRDSSDTWSPTIDEINNRDYDYVKLHRLSTNFDVGIAPFSMGICFDGTLVLPAVEQFHDRNVALAKFNQTLTEFLLGGIYCEAATPDDIGYGTLSYTAYAKVVGSGGGPMASLHQALRTKHAGNLDAIKLFHPESVLVEDLEVGLQSGRSLLERVGQFPHEQLLYGTTFYVRKQWAEALIHFWTVTERLVEIVWEARIIQGSGVINKRRKTFLQDHRTWPISTKLELLTQKGLLPVDLLSALDAVRKVRNDFVHEGVQPTHETVERALTSCFELTSLCASDFTDRSLLASVALRVKDRCNPELYPERHQLLNPTHWVALPPLPGDKEWGDRPYEIVEELMLKPLNNS